MLVSPMYFQARSGRCNQLRKRGNSAGLNGEKLPYVIPDVNISIDNPVAVVDKTLINTVPEVAEAFVDFLFSSCENFTRLASDPLTPRWQKK